MELLFVRVAISIVCFLVGLQAVRSPYNLQTPRSGSPRSTRLVCWLCVLLLHWWLCAVLLALAGVGGSSALSQMGSFVLGVMSTSMYSAPSETDVCSELGAGVNAGSCHESSSDTGASSGQAIGAAAIRPGLALLEARDLAARMADIPELRSFGNRKHWRLVCDVDQGQAQVLRRTDQCNGDLILRVVARLACQVPELLSLVIELDLMPTWNRFCAVAEVFHRVTCIDLYAGGAAQLPWPIPRYNILLRARLLNLMDTLGCMLVVARTPEGQSFRFEDPPYEATLPAKMQGRRQLPLKVAACALTPLAVGEDGSAAGVSFDLVVHVQLSAAAFVPGWVIDFVMRRVVPWLCRRVLALVQVIATQPDSEFRRRIAQDSTGVYAHINSATSERLKDGPLSP